MTFGEVLLMLMKEKGITPTELAQRSGVKKSTINELIKGRSREPTFSKAKRLANGLGVPLELFAELVDES